MCRSSVEVVGSRFWIAFALVLSPMIIGAKVSSLTGIAIKSGS
jgi:hypothetical protein